MDWKKALRRAAIAVLALALAGSLGYIIYRDADRAAGAASYEEASAVAVVPDLMPSPAPSDVPRIDGSTQEGNFPSESPGASERPSEGAGEAVPVFTSLESLDLEALRARAPQALGWIAIPGVLSYPLMRGTDNSYYLNHTWNGTRSAVGAVFMDYRCAADLSDFNTVIYAHRTFGDAMFGSLGRYASQSFWAAHPDVYLATDAGVIRYRIYAAYEASLTGLTYYNRISAQERREEFIASGAELSSLQADALPGPEDSVITLSTCTSDGRGSTRWVVQAFRAEG